MWLEVSTPIIVDMNETDGDPSRSVAAPHSAAAPLPSHTIAHPLVGAILGGVLLGLSDLLAQNTLPYPWANLANSAAVWALGAFVIGAWSRGSLRSTAAAGMVLLLVAVEIYYIAAAPSCMIASPRSGARRLRCGWFWPCSSVRSLPSPAHSSIAGGPASGSQQRDSLARYSLSRPSRDSHGHLAAIHPATKSTPP